MPLLHRPPTHRLHPPTASTALTELRAAPWCLALLLQVSLSALRSSSAARHFLVSLQSLTFHSPHHGTQSPPESPSIFSSGPFSACPKPSPRNVLSHPFRYPLFPSPLTPHFPFELISPQGCLDPSQSHSSPLHSSPLGSTLPLGALFFSWLPFILYSFFFLRTFLLFPKGIILPRMLWTPQPKTQPPSKHTSPGLSIPALSPGPEEARLEAPPEAGGTWTFS